MAAASGFVVQRTYDRCAGSGQTRFPADKEAVAAKKIADTLDKLGAGPQDLTLTQGACGGDILFAEACLQRGIRLHLLLPFEEPTFI